MLRWLQEYILSWLQKRCKHPDHAVKADILEGESDYRFVQWCEKCGAFRFCHFEGNRGEIERIKIPDEWRIPKPLWSK